MSRVVANAFLRVFLASLRRQKVFRYAGKTRHHYPNLVPSTWIAKYPPEHKQSAVLAALTIVQDQNGGWLSPEAMDAVAEYLGMPRVSVYEVGSLSRY